MRLKSSFNALRGASITLQTTRSFTTTPRNFAKNRLYPSRIRSDDELQTLVLMSSSSRIPLITLWMTTWSRDCDEVSPILKDLIETEKVGEDRGAVFFVEVEMDSPDLGGLTNGVGMQRYLVQKVPTLLAFDRGEAQVRTKVEDIQRLKDRAFLRRWIETEAARQG